MPGPYKRKKYHFGDNHLKKGWRTKRRTKDLDEIDKDLIPAQSEKIINQEVDLDKPGLGQFYCVHCAKHFIDDKAFSDHVRSKPHKRRLHALKTQPYTIEESEKAAGMGSYIKPLKRKMETIVPESVKSKEKIEQILKKAKLASTLDEDGDLKMK